jgi:vitamin B12 transporter
VRSVVDEPEFIDTTENDAYWYDGSNVNADLIINFTIAKINIVTIGGELLNEKGSATSAYYNAWASPPGFESETLKEKSALTKSVFVHDSLSLADVFFLNAGARLDNHATFGSHYTWDVSSSIVIPFTGTRFRASAGTGFRAPSLYELYSSYGNEELGPEKTFVYDAGIVQDFGDILSVDCGAFKQKYKNLIAFPSGASYDNIDGTVKNSGAEAAAVLKLVGFISLTYGYTYIKYEGDAASRAALKRPKHKHYASVLVMPLNGLNIMLMYTHTGKRMDAYFDSLTYATQEKPLGSYGKLDLNIRYALNGAFEFTLRCENLTNADYQESYGYNTKGRTFYGGMQASL